MKLLITFVLGFDYHDFDPVDYDEELKSYMSKNRKSSSYASNDDVIKGNNLIEPLPHLKKECRIHYDLPKEGNKVIKVVYLGTCADVSFDNASVPTKCVVVGDKSFIHFTIVHNLETSDLTAPKSLKARIINFDFNITQELAKNKIENKVFLYEHDENDINFGYLLEPKNLKTPDKLYIKANHSDYLLRRTCKFHWQNTNTLIKNAANKLNEAALNLNIDENTDADDKRESIKFNDDKPEKKSKRDNPNKNKKSKIDEPKPPEVSLHITGSQLLYEKSVWTLEKVNSSAELLYGGLIITSSNVFTSEQRSFYKTLSINIKNINSLPPSITKRHEIKAISIEYSLPPICSLETIEPKELLDVSKISFNDFRIFLNDGIPNDELIETIQSRTLIVKILGIREKKNADKEPRVWGQELFCMDFSKRYNKITNPKELENINQNITETKSKSKTNKSKQSKKPSKLSTDFTEETKKPIEETVVIGFAPIRLYDLMRYCQRIVTFVPVKSMFCDDHAHVNIPLRPMNAMYLHRDFNPPLKGIVNVNEFNEHKTMLKVEIKIGYDLTKNLLNGVLASPLLYARCIIIDNNPNASYSLLNELLGLNKIGSFEADHQSSKGFHNLCLSPNVRPRRISMSEETESIAESIHSRHRTLSVTQPRNQKYFTGFMIDAIDYCILVIECVETQAISQVMLHRYMMLQEQGHMLYNSNLVFTERLYNDFLKFGGIFVSALGVPLDAVLSHGNSTTWVPTPALRCLETIKRITRAKRIKSDLFPSTAELLSMDLEFGVPLYEPKI